MQDVGAGGMRPDYVDSGLGTPRRKVSTRVYTLVSSSTGGGGGGSGSDHGNGLWSELASLHCQQSRPRLGARILEGSGCSCGIRPKLRLYNVNKSNALSRL